MTRFPYSTRLGGETGPRTASTTIRVVDGPKCPRCGSLEVLLGGTVRPFKVDAGRGGWESNCDARLVDSITDTHGCGIWFLEDGTITEDSNG